MLKRSVLAIVLVLSLLGSGVSSAYGLTAEPVDELGGIDAYFGRIEYGIHPIR